MSEAAKAARAAMKAKAHRLVGSSKGAVDASGWTEPTDMNADVKTGARPVSPRLYKRGGKVEGAMAKHHAGRKPRKSGGRAITADSLINRDVREANDERAGKKHDGAFKRGGKVKRQHHADGNPVIQQGREAPPVTTSQRMKEYNPSPDYIPQINRDYVLPKGPSAEDRAAMDALAASAASGRKHGGRAHKLAGGPTMNPQQMAAMMQAGQRPGLAQTLMRRKHGGKAEHPDVAEDKALIRKMVKPEARTGKKDGGSKWIQGAIKHPGALHKSLHVPAGEKIPAKKLAKAAHSDNPKLAKRARLAETLKHMHHAKGGSAVADGEYEGTRPTGGRMARKDGGRAGKGKMNVNIIIAGKHPDSAMGNPMMPPGGMPPRPPAQPVAVPPPQGMPPAGVGAPMPIPVPMPMQAGPQGMPPMGRKSGGRAYPIHDGAGGGEGRLQKMKAYGLTPPRG